MYTKNNDSLISFLEKYGIKQHIESLEEDPSLLAILFTKSDGHTMYSQTYIKMVLFICHLMATFKVFLDTCDQGTR